MFCIMFRQDIEARIQLLYFFVLSKHLQLKCNDGNTMTRDEYAMEELLGGRRGKFSIEQRKFRRDDLVLVRRGHRGHRAQCLFRSLE